jgi:glyoxylase-like metal-dependent hydrolase (beta-lactamase superfamily II)
MTMSNPGFYHRRIGDFVVTAIFDGMVEIPLDAVTTIAPAQVRRLQDDDLRAYPPMLPTLMFAVTRGEDTIIIDAGGARELDAGLGLGRANLLAAGIDPDNVSAVLLTHLHTDHYGGLVLSDGSPAFPNAHLVVHMDEHRHRFGPTRTDGGSTASPPDYLLRAVAPYADRMRLIEGGAVLPDIEALHLPGHTPGHTGFRIGSGPERLLIWGDVVHLPAIQFSHPEASMRYDVDGGQAASSRTDAFREATNERHLVAGMHMDFPGVGHVATKGDAYRWIPEPYRHEI